MRNNKILAAAVASALSLGAGNAFAAASPKLVLLQPAASTPPAVGNATVANTAAPATAAKYAAELFTDATKAIATDAGTQSTSFDPGTDDRHFIVGFKLDVANDNDALTSSLLVVTATLNGGTWGDNVVPAQALYCNSAAITIAAPASCNMLYDNFPAEISKSGIGGTDKDNVVSFSIQSRKGGTSPFWNASEWFYFSFDVDDLATFSTTNVPLTLEMKGEYVLGTSFVQPLGTPQTVTLASFAPGASLAINAAPEPPTVKVDVAENSLKFKKDKVTSTTTAAIGTVSLVSGDVRKYDGSSDYTTASIESTLTINSGPFSASRTAPGMVFIDVNGGDTYTEGTDIPCTVSSDTTATCTISSTKTPTVPPAGFEYNIMVIADGVTEILPQDDPPNAIWKVSVDGGAEKAYPATLTHIKSNGTKCTLYNVPDETGGLDGTSIRITNKNSKTAGKVFGQIVLEDGSKPYGITPLELLTLEPSQTVRLYSGDAAANANAAETPPPFDLTFGGKYSWAGQRARLIITSTLVSGDLEAVALVRNKLHGGPGMNMSTGATGSGCK